MWLSPFHMRLSDEQIRRFKALYEKRFSRTLTQTEAMELAEKLIGLVSMIYQPIKKTELAKSQVRQAILPE
jgi:hypothetical protein